MEDDHRPLLSREPAKAPLELVTNGDRALWVAACRGNRSLNVELDGSVAPVSLSGPVARPDQQPMKPRIEAVGIAQAAQILPGADQGLLHGILCQLMVTQDEAGDRKQAARGST